MKRFIKCGRDKNTHYKHLKISGWSHGKLDLLSQIKLLDSPDVNNQKVLDNLLSQVRDSLSQTEDLLSKLSEYQSILQRFNTSQHTVEDVNDLELKLSNFKF